MAKDYAETRKADQAARRAHAAAEAAKALHLSKLAEQQAEKRRAELRRAAELRKAKR